MSENKDKGTKAETAVVRYAIQCGWPHAERRALSGTGDRGDITGIIGVCIQVKDVADPKFSKWFKDTLEQAGRCDDALPILIHKRRMKNIRKWDAYIPLHFLMGEEAHQLDPVRWVRMDLENMFWYLKEMGY